MTCMGSDHVTVCRRMARVDLDWEDVSYGGKKNDSDVVDKPVSVCITVIFWAIII